MSKIPFDVKFKPQIESGEYTLETRDGNRARIICWDREDNDNQPLVALVKKRCCEVVIYTKINGEYLGTYGHGYDLFIVTPEEELTDFEQEVSDIVEYCKKNGENVVKSYAKRHAKSLLSLAREQFIKDGYVIEKKAFHDAVKKVDPEVMKEVSKNIDNTERTEFEQELVNFFEEGNAILPDKDGVYNKRDCEEFLHKSASKLLAIAEKELSAKYKVSSDMNGFAYGKGYEEGKKEAEENLTEQISDLVKDFETYIKNNKDLLSVAFDEGCEEGKADALKDLARWKKIGQGNNYSSETKFCINGRYLEMNDTLNCLYEIALKDLEKLPKEDEK